MNINMEQAINDSFERITKLHEPELVVVSEESYRHGVDVFELQEAVRNAMLELQEHAEYLEDIT